MEATRVRDSCSPAYSLRIRAPKTKDTGADSLVALRRNSRLGSWIFLQNRPKTYGLNWSGVGDFFPPSDTLPFTNTAVILFRFQSVGTLSPHHYVTSVPATLFLRNFGNIRTKN